MLTDTVEIYFEKFFEVLSSTRVTWCSSKKEEPSLSEAVECVITSLFKNHRNGKKIMVIGNGGSAAIAMHTLADYANAGGLKTFDFYSPGLLTCMANDYGYENVFARPIELFADSGDMLFAISSSGRSPNIINACEAGHNRGCEVITFSGFDSGNPLRKTGRLNFYVPSSHYGFVELTHQTLLHCILDLFVKKKI